jgi:D-3-phosphoglycerate dehydrogenase
MTARVLICDPIAQDGIELLERFGARVDVRTGLPAKELIAIVAEYEALIVRSETKATREIIEAAHELKVIGRAGIGVDNIDLEAATHKGVVVVNAPTGNIISAAEHTVALMLALARNIPEADASLKAGRWDRKRLVGLEVRGKTLGVLGLGQVGSEVAKRARGLEMRVIAHDPFVSEDRARSLGVEIVSQEELLRDADFVTVHTRLTEGTKNLVGESELRSMKPTARIINTARGGIIDESALKKALDEEWIAGAALDVYEQEPITDHPLFGTARAITTPHLGASTAEAQERVAVDVAEQVIAVLKGEPALYAVNAPLISAETYEYLAPYVEVASKVGSLAVQLCEGQIGPIEMDYAGELVQHDVTPLKAAIVGGMLAPISEEHVNIVNVDIVAQRRGLEITEVHGAAHDMYANLITVRVSTSEGETKVSGALAHDGPHIVQIDDFWVDVPPSEGYLLACHNRDRPGMIGAVGMLLGEFNVNISFMNVGRHEKRGTALMVLTLDEALTSDQLAQVQEIPGIIETKLARL